MRVEKNSPRNILHKKEGVLATSQRTKTIYHANTHHKTNRSASATRTTSAHRIAVNGLSINDSRHAEVVGAHHHQEHLHLVAGPPQHLGQAARQRVAVHELHHGLRHDGVQVSAMSIELVANARNERLQAAPGHLSGGGDRSRSRRRRKTEEETRERVRTSMGR